MELNLIGTSRVLHQKNLTVTPVSSLPCFHISLNKLDQIFHHASLPAKPVRAPSYPGTAKRIIRVILTVTTTGTAKAQV